MKVKYLDKDKLKVLSHKAPTPISKKIINSIPDLVLMPVVRHMTHNDSFVRCWVCYSEHGQELVIDMSHKEFNDLPLFEEKQTYYKLIGPRIIAPFRRLYAGIRSNEFGRV